VLGVLRNMSATPLPSVRSALLVGQPALAITLPAALLIMP
jgi:hypothetical protein